MAGWCAAAAAQTFYKWTDNQGVVHLTNAPPPQQEGVEQLQLPRPKAPPETDEQAAPQETGGSAENGTPAPAAQGPAKLIIATRQTPRTGPRSMHISGEVKNVGGAAAQNVGVTISATDSGQGNPCLHEEAGVNPATLGPNESGRFDVNVDSPCLYGEPAVDVQPTWK